MKITTRKFKNKDLTKIIKQAAKFYALQLIPKQYEQIHLEINARKIKADGTCFFWDDNDFEIELNPNLTFEHIMITLAHEMVHLKQYAKKELKSKYVKGKSIDVWKGVKYRNLKYKDQPWEHEATEMELDLFHNFIWFGLLTGVLDITTIKQIDLN